MAAATRQTTAPPRTTPNIPKSNIIPVCSLAQRMKITKARNILNQAIQREQILNDAAQFLALTLLPHGLCQRYDASAASVNRVYIGKGGIKSCRGVRRNQSWNTPATDEKAQGNRRAQSGPRHKMKSPDSLFLILPKTYYGVSEFSGNHFIYFFKIPFNQTILHLFHDVIQLPIKKAYDKLFSFELMRRQKSLLGMQA